ncbi:hypothetical protein C0J52_16233 [Blattella germanica]|nr:hypothetical protein C0J52_16233 [Blattella germanica]
MCLLLICNCRDVISQQLKLLVVDLCRCPYCEAHDAAGKLYVGFGVVYIKLSLYSCFAAIKLICSSYWIPIDKLGLITIYLEGHSMSTDLVYKKIILHKKCISFC